jgi:phosphoglycolate phosphatase-like HAD superfamily hydrolase
MIKAPNTIISDLDGTLIKTNSNGGEQHLHKAELLPGVKEKLIEWNVKAYNIILITGRRESTRKATEQQLHECGIVYDQLVMGVGGGIRILINDLKPNGEEDTAIAINVKRNSGLKDIET